MIELIVNIFYGFLVLIGALTALICAVAYWDYVKCKWVEQESEHSVRQSADRDHTGNGNQLEEI